MCNFQLRILSKFNSSLSKIYSQNSILYTKNESKLHTEFESTVTLYYVLDWF